MRHFVKKWLVEKRKPFPQVCCEFLIPVKKTVPTKNLEHFQTCKGENDMGARIFCLFRFSKTFGQKSWSNQRLKKDIFFSILDKFYLPRLKLFGWDSFLGLQYSPHSCVPEYPMYFNDLFVCTNQGRPGYKIWSTFLQKQISSFLYYKNRILRGKERALFLSWRPLRCFFAKNQGRRKVWKSGGAQK